MANFALCVEIADRIIDPTCDACSTGGTMSAAAEAMSYVVWSPVEGLGPSVALGLGLGPVGGS